MPLPLASVIAGGTQWLLRQVDARHITTEVPMSAARDLSPEYPEDIALMRDMYARRHGIKTLATKFHVSADRVKELVAGVEQIPGPRRRRESELWEREAARKLAAQKVPVADIARELARSTTTIRHWLRPGAEEVRAANEKLLAELAEKKRQAVALFDLDYYSINRIASKVGSSWVAVEKWLKESGRIA